VSGSKLFGNAVLEAAARADLYEFEGALAVLAALRKPDVNLPSAHFFYLALASRVRAALRGTVEETERRVRESRLLEDALVLLFKDYVSTAFRDAYSGIYHYLRSLDAALHQLSELAVSGEHRKLYASLSSVTFLLVRFAASGYLDTFFEAVRRALEAGLVDAGALCAELNLMIDEDGIKQQFLALFERYIGAELGCGGGGS
jgi:hypothetical protein